MTITTTRIEKFEDMSFRLQEAMCYMNSAIDELEGASDGLCAEIISVLRDLISSAETEKENCDEVLAEVCRHELATMNNEYERSVL